MPLDTLPLYEVIDSFRKDCSLAQVINSLGVVRIKPDIDFNHCHVIDFGYLFNIGSGKPEALTENDCSALKQIILDHGISLAYPHMLFVERVCRSHTSDSTLFMTYVYQKNGLPTLEYYMKDETLKHWIKSGHIDSLQIRTNGIMAMNVRQWGLMVPRSGMPAEDTSPANHFARMTIALLGMLMRRGDEVEQTFITRPPIQKPKGFQKKSVASVSVIRLNRTKYVKNMVDEQRAKVTLSPHDRAGTISHRIKDENCVHVWKEEYRDDKRWRNRCAKCDSCQFWRSEAKVHGGAVSITLHKIA